jgi:hypothetical protein
MGEGGWEKGDGGRGMREGDGGRRFSNNILRN